jgi:RimJ/RimL family protein N-acetyltransferase
VIEIEKIELRGQNYYLRTFRPEDVSQRYLNWLHDTEVTRFLEVRLSTHTLESLREWVSDFDSKRKFLFGIYTIEDDAHIGTATLYDIHSYHGTANYGYLVGEKQFWGKGVVVEIVSLLFDFAFGQLGVRKITTGSYINNIASVVNYKKLGLKQEACLKGHLRLEERYVDQVLFSIFKEEWEEYRTSNNSRLKG